MGMALCGAVRVLRPKRPGLFLLRQLARALFTRGASRAERLPGAARAPPAEASGPRSKVKGWASGGDRFSAASLLICSTALVLRRVAPKLLHTLKCVQASLPVAVGYARTRARVRGAPAGGAGEGERLWRAQHRRAASRLCHLLTDFHEPPLLGSWPRKLQSLTVFVTAAGQDALLSPFAPRHAPSREAVAVSLPPVSISASFPGAHLLLPGGAPHDQPGPEASEPAAPARHVAPSCEGLPEWLSQTTQQGGPNRGQPRFPGLVQSSPPPIRGGGLGDEQSSSAGQLTAASHTGVGLPESASDSSLDALYPSDFPTSSSSSSSSRASHPGGEQDVPESPISGGPREGLPLEGSPCPTASGGPGAPPRRGDGRTGYQEDEGATQELELFRQEGSYDAAGGIYEGGGLGAALAGPLAASPYWLQLYERALLALRALWLLVIFGPLIVWGPLAYWVSRHVDAARGAALRAALWWCLRFCLEQCGAAFIKWGQWSSSREDLFPEELCLCLERLNDRAPAHGFGETKRAILESFGRPYDELFDDFEPAPWASGSIAQIHRARLRGSGSGGDEPPLVAVKVRHPRVATQIHQDFQIMGALAAWLQRLPALKWLQLEQTVAQFSHTMSAQADLRVEARNLARFQKNFSGLEGSVVFPSLYPDLVTEGVIVESFERGGALHEFLHSRTTLNTQIAAVGVDTYLKMLLVDNFVHTDLHPGNILARMAEGEHGELTERLQLVVLDFGLAEELAPLVRFHFISFILMIGAGDGERAAHHLLHFSNRQRQRCVTPGGLIADMRALFGKNCNLKDRPIDLNAVLKDVLRLCHKHEVTVDSAYASLVIAVCIIVGFAQTLDPNLSILDAAVPCLFMYNLTGQVMGRIYG